MNTSTSVKSILFALLVAIVCVGCANSNSGRPRRIALLAPFEGRYREIGYDALYAARLALLDEDRTDIELLAVDDGGSVRTATERARALSNDSRILAVVVLGYDAADSAVQRAFDDLPVVIVGEWLVEPQRGNIHIFSSPDIPDQLSHQERLDVTDAARVDVPFVGGEVFALEGFRAIREDFVDITVVTSGEMPDADFYGRILDIDQFASPPGILARNVYGVFRIVIQHNLNNAQNNIDSPTSTPNWRDPPIYYYTISTDNQLIITNNTIE